MFLFRKKDRGSTGHFDEGKIVYIHKDPKPTNIGDYLCSPRHYVELETKREQLYILGGGVFKDYGLKYLRKQRIALSDCILWGVGTSRKYHQRDTTPVDLSSTLAWGIRDQIDYGGKNAYLPCVSCLHPMLGKAQENKEKKGTVIFLNKDSSVTQLDRDFEATLTERYPLVTNNCSEENIAGTLRDYDHIITNSYHGTYWGLLSGCRVTVIAYSDKFNSLLEMLKLPQDKIITYVRSEERSLENAVKQATVPDAPSVVLQDPQAVLLDHQSINRRFLDQLKKENIISSYNFKGSVTE